jgi:carbon storage regulator
MLILTRKVDQGIVIQGNIIITVLRVERDRVKLGIAAPQEITVLREELLQRDGGQNRKLGPADTERKDPRPFPRLHFSRGRGDRFPEELSSDASDGN